MGQKGGIGTPWTPPPPCIRMLCLKRNTFKIRKSLICSDVSHGFKQNFCGELYLSRLLRIRTLRERGFVEGLYSSEHRNFSPGTEGVNWAWSIIPLSGGCWRGWKKSLIHVSLIGRVSIPPPRELWGLGPGEGTLG